MKLSQLKDIIREMINEQITLNELIEETFDETEVNNIDEGKWDYPKDIRTPKKTSADADLGNNRQDRAKKARKAFRTAAKAKAHKALTGGGPKIKNPKTGKEILATTAYKAGPSHPAYALAKTALKKQISECLN